MYDKTPVYRCLHNTNLISKRHKGVHITLPVIHAFRVGTLTHTCMYVCVMCMNVRISMFTYVRMLCVYMNNQNMHICLCIYRFDSDYIEIRSEFKTFKLHEKYFTYIMSWTFELKLIISTK